MKKIIFLCLSFVVLVPVALAATLVSNYQTVVDKYESREMAPLIITSTSDGDITAKNGIRILLSNDWHVLFGIAPLTITGSAIDNGKVNLNVKADYVADHKSVFIPVMKDFASADWLSVQGLVLRAYDQGTPDLHLGMDLNGDGVADVQDINSYSVRDTLGTDTTSPFPVADAKSAKNTDGSVTLTWNAPPDYDFYDTVIMRTRIKNGFTQTIKVYEGTSTTYTDSDLAGVSSASYSLTALDNTGNQSDPVVLNVDLSAPITPTPSPTPTTTPTPTSPVTKPTPSDAQVQEMNRLLSYYNVRYSVKCMPSGVPVSSADSACLWARIDLIYAQQVTGTAKVPGLALSDQDLTLMKARRQWPEKRYQDNCSNAATPANYCPALKDSLDRISYFLD